MERTPSNFNIVKVLEKKKKKNSNSGHQRNHRNSIFNVRTQKNPYSPLQRYRSLQKKKEKRKTENLDDSGKIEKIPIDGPTQRIKTSIVEKISLRPPRLVVNS